MQLSKRQTDVVVGAFVVLGVVAIVAATMWAREAKLGSGKAVVVARFRDVGSAGVGTNAYIRGLRAGRVAAIELGDDGWVRVRVALDPAVRLPADPVVVLGAAGLVGEWQATIAPRDAAPDDPDVRRQLAAAAGERGGIPSGTMPTVRQFAARRPGRRGRECAGGVRRHGRPRCPRGDRERVHPYGAARRHERIVPQHAARADSASAGGGLQHAIRDIAAAAADIRATAGELRSFTARGGDTRVALDRVLARVDTLVGRTTAGQGTIGRAVGDPSLYANADSLLMELRSLVADVKAHPKRYISIRVF